MGNQPVALEELDPELFGRMHGILLGLVSQQKHVEMGQTKTVNLNLNLLDSLKLTIRT